MGLGLGVFVLHSDPCIFSISHSLLMPNVLLYPLSDICGFPLIHMFKMLSISDMFLVGVSCSSSRTFIFCELSGKHWSMIWSRLFAVNPHSQISSTPELIVVASCWSAPVLDSCLLERWIHVCV